MKVAIIGLSTPHVREFARLLNVKDIEIAVIWDYTRSGADLFCRDFRCTDAMDDLDMIVDEGLDGVLVCSKPEDHVRHAVPFIVGGVPAYIEEPMATTDADRERIIEAVREHGTPIMTPESLKCPSGESGEYEISIIETFLWMCETGEPPAKIT